MKKSDADMARIRGAGRRTPAQRLAAERRMVKVINGELVAPFGLHPVFQRDWERRRRKRML